MSLETCQDSDTQSSSSPRDLGYFNKGASKYNRWFAPYINTTVNCILKHLSITPDDIIVDIGGGTAEVAQRVWKQGHLKNPILCVDPSEGMIEIAKGKDGIDTFLATAEEFITSEKATSEPAFTKVLICGCAYLFIDREAVYAGLKAHLPANKGPSCIITYLSYMSPLIPAAAESDYFKTGFVQKEFEVDTKLFNKVGLKWKGLDIVETHPLGKSDWYDLHRTRMLRCTRGLSDAEIEEGIQELEKKYGSQEVLDIDVHLKVAILEN